MNPENDRTAGIRYIPEIGQDIEITFNYLKYSSINRLRRQMTDNFYSSVIAELSKIMTGNVLDVGCGEGYTLNRLVRAGIGNCLVGIDVSETAIILGKKLFPDLTLIQGDIYNLPFDDNLFDTVICTEVLEHLREPQKAIRELKRVSNKYLLLSVPNEPLASLRNLVIGKNIRRLGRTKGHLNTWNRHSFCNLVKQEELNILGRSTPFPYTILLLAK